MNVKRLFSSESVSVGHPDFVATAISDAILDFCVAADKKSRCGIEVMCVPNKVILGGEITTKADLNDETLGTLVRQVVASIGYTKPEYGFCACDDPDCPNKLQIENNIHTQSPDINQGVDKANDEIGCGDQGIMFGYACNETSNYYPLAAAIANEIMRVYTRYFKKHQDILSPDAKSQVTIDYANECIDTIVIAASHKEDVSPEKLRNIIEKHILLPALQNVELGARFEDEETKTAYDLMTKDTKILINTTGKFVICGPYGDAGIEGRKLAVDSYGGYAHIGGGNLHGKCASKSDFSYAVYSRYLAKNLVAAGVAPQVEIQLASAIGVSTPVSIYVEADFLDDEQCLKIATILQENLDMSCNAIIEQLHLLETNRTSTNFDYTFGLQPKKEEGLPLPYFHPWESLDLVPKFKELFKNI